MKRTLSILFPLSLAALLLHTLPASAFNLTRSPFFRVADSFLGGSLSAVNDFIQEAYGYVESILDADSSELLDLILGEVRSECTRTQFVQEACSPITPDGPTLAQVLEGAAGTLGIPSPASYEKEIDYQIDRSTKLPSWGYYGNGRIAGPLVKNAGTRGIAFLRAESLLGDRGQQAARERLESHAELAAGSIAAGERALNATSTQDAVKMLAWIQAQQAVLEQQQSQAAEMSRIDAQIGNLNLSNISRTLDQQENRDAVEQRIVSDGFVNAAVRSGLF